ncbi:MAG: phospholipase [Planctomycetota bacterium]|nr:MAG: phospholipase [Planctomycetota bacterium]
MHIRGTWLATATAGLMAAACGNGVNTTFAAGEGNVQSERKAVNPAQVYEERSIAVPEGEGTATFRYRLLKPLHADDAGRHWPLVLFLHGAGERGDDNAMHLKFLPKWLAAPEMRERYPCFVLVPQCRKGHQWVDVPWADQQSTPQAPGPTTDLAAAVAALDDVIAKERVDTSRIYLTGLSMGGYGTWDLGARMPERFAALLPICGGGDENTVGRIAKLPVWCFHGDADTAVPVGRSRAMIEALRAAGGSPKYSELPGVGHDSWTPAYRDPAVLDWLFEQSR